jgi:glutamate mutase epsilon subunit
MAHLMFDIDSSTSIEAVLEESGVKKYKISGIFSTIGEKNRNGRIYPREVWETEITRYQTNFDTGSMDTLMEWEHPARTEVDPMEAVAKITKLKIDGKYILGEAVLLDNPKANQLKSLIDNGIKISVSSRGVGTVKNGIVENFKLVTYDIVKAPSDYNATMNGLVESYKLNEGIIEDINYEITESGNVKVCTKDICEMYKKEDIVNAFVSKISDLIEK